VADTEEDADKVSIKTSTTVSRLSALLGDGESVTEVPSHFHHHLEVHLSHRRTGDAKHYMSHGTGILESVRCRLPSSSTFELFVPSYRPSLTGDWPSLVSCCSRNCLEHIACPSQFITIYRSLVPTAEDIFVSTVIFRHHHLTLLTVLPSTSKFLRLF